MTYASIDLGSDTVKIVVCECCDNKYNVIASTNTRVVGIKKGVIKDEAMVIKSIELAISEIEKQLGFRIDKAIISIPSYDVNINIYNGECEVSGLVSGSDIATCFKKAIKENVSDEEEVITVFPIDFVIDDEERVIDPKGMNAYKLSTRVLISTVPKELVYAYVDIFQKCNIEVIDLCFSTLGDFYQSVNKDYQKNVGAVVNIGSSKTEISIFNKGLMIKSLLIPMGSKMIDKDIKYVYHIDGINARNLKEKFALANSQYAEDEIIELVNLEGESMIISQREISQIIEARIEEILKNVKKYLNNLTNKEISYIIITGGITDIPGFSSVVENVFGDIIHSVNMNVLGIRSNLYSSCMGMIKYLHEKLQLRGINYTMYDLTSLKKEKKKTVLNDFVVEKIEEYLNNN